MTWEAVARKDFRDAKRSWLLWGLSTIFVTVIGGSSLIFGVMAGDGASSDALFGLFAGIPGIAQLSYTGLLAFIIALLSLIAAYGSVIDERESGTLKLLLSLPHSRRDVIAGKLAGRSAVVVLPVLGGFLIAVLLLALTGVDVAFGNLVPQVLLTVVLTLAFVAIAVGISAWSDSNRQATFSTFGAFFLFSMLWSPIAKGIPYAVSELGDRLPLLDPLGQQASIKLSLFIKYLNPLRAYETLAASIYFDSTVQARLVQAGFRERIVGQQMLSESIPFYLQDTFLALVLIGWIVAPPLLGYYVFSETDL